MEVLFNFLKRLRDRKVVLFGTGKASEIISRYFPVNIDYYVDNNQDKWGNRFLEREIKNPSILGAEDKNSIVVVVASMYYKEIATQLIEEGLVEYESCWNGMELFGEVVNREIVNQANNNQQVNSKNVNDSGRVKGRPVHSYSYRKSSVDRFRKYVDLAGKTILEVGSDAECEVVKMLAEEAKSVTGITKYLAHWKFEGDKARVSDKILMYNGDIRYTNYPDNSFDAIFSIATFEHIIDLPAALKEMYRILKPDGILYSNFSPVWSSARGHHVHADIDGEAVRFWSPLHNPIPDYYHILLNEEEMYNFLLGEHSENYAREVARGIYRTDSVNRLFYEDYVDIFNNSDFTVLHFNEIGIRPINDEVKRLLEAKYGNKNNYSCDSIEVVLKK